MGNTVNGDAVRDVIAAGGEKLSAAVLEAGARHSSKRGAHVEIKARDGDACTFEIRLRDL